MPTTARLTIGLPYLWALPPALNVLPMQLPYLDATTDACSYLICGPHRQIKQVPDTWAHDRGKCSNGKARNSYAAFSLRRFPGGVDKGLPRARRAAHAGVVALSVRGGPSSETGVEQGQGGALCDEEEDLCKSPPAPRIFGSLRTKRQVDRPKISYQGTSAVHKEWIPIAET